MLVIPIIVMQIWQEIKKDKYSPVLRIYVSVPVFIFYFATFF
jgi:hypothetical protein